MCQCTLTKKILFHKQGTFPNTQTVHIYKEKTFEAHVDTIRLAETRTMEPPEFQNGDKGAVDGGTVWGLCPGPCG